MGDRANVYVKEGDEGVFLYTHWAGTELPETVRKALGSKIGRDRWDDAHYLSRIIFSQMIREDIDGECGFGIWSSIGDGAGRVVTIDIAEEKVFVNDKEYTFDEFCDLEEARW